MFCASFSMLFPSLALLFYPVVFRMLAMVTPYDRDSIHNILYEYSIPGSTPDGDRPQQVLSGDVRNVSRLNRLRAIREGCPEDGEQLHIPGTREILRRHYFSPRVARFHDPGGRSDWYGPGWSR